ncbi:MAG: sacsin N-terminal ATP-binding-like domain-containing protein [Desulfobaccales bacterium]
MKKWVERELEKVRQSYIAQILNMTGAYHREIERTKEYHGRQLLELLQNADDEAAHAEIPSVLIKLEDDRLIIANNGNYFSKRGILSLMYSDNSPKIKLLKKIGYKGLGFRAILNWSHSLWIKSGPVSLEFSKQHAIDFLNDLIDKKPSLKKEIKKNSLDKYPIATLSVPKWKGSHDFNTSEYDTYIVIYFASPEIKDDIQSQINELGMEVLIFLNNLKMIKLESPLRNEVIEKIPLKKRNYQNIRIVNEEGKVTDSKKWRIFSANGKLPDSLRIGESARQYEYDLRIAINE